MLRHSIALSFSLLIFVPLSNEFGAASSHAGDQSISDQTPPDTAISDRLIGEWQSEKFGRQILTTRADGTAVLEMRLNAMAAILYGRRVTLQLEWKLNGNILTQHVVGGSPERNMRKLTRKYGTTYCYQIVEVSDHQMIVTDTSTGKTSCWKSLTPGSQGK